MSTTIAGAIIVVENTAGSRPSGVISTVHCGPAVRVANVVHLALLKQGIVLVALTGRWCAHTGTTRAEVILILLEVVSRVRRKGGLALGGEGGIGDCVGEGTGATEVHHIAEGHPSGDSKEKAKGWTVSYW
jgi:hypothetical protein